jgi:glycosyltransferase involved in cell wall biosynthesis
MLSCAFPSMRPIASVVMPAYNTASWVHEAIQSVVSQTFTDWELVVVDDGSTDGTGDVTLSIKDGRIRIIRQNHLGTAAARNAAIEATSGQYVAFLDSDDLWLPTMLEQHVRVLDHRPEVDLAFCWSAIIDEAGVTTRHMLKAAAGPTSFEDILTTGAISNGSCVVVRRQALEGAGPFDTNLRAATDFDMWLRIALLRADNVWCVPEALTKYRRRMGQATKDWRAAHLHTNEVVLKMRRAAQAIPGGVWRRAEATNFRSFAFMAYESGECGSAAGLLVRAVARAPWFLMTDARVWSLASAIAARIVLPDAIFQRARRLWASTNKLSSGRLSSNSTSGKSPT